MANQVLTQAIIDEAIKAAGNITDGLKNLGNTGLYDMNAVNGATGKLTSSVENQVGAGKIGDGNPLYKSYGNGNPVPVDPTANGLTGANDWLSMAGAFGGTDANGYRNSGWANSAYTMGKTAFDGYMAYEGLQETKKQNAINVEAKNIALARQEVDQGNKIAQVRRNNAMGLSGGGGNYATIAAVARNPYSVYAKQQLRY